MPDTNKGSSIDELLGSSYIEDIEEINQKEFWDPIYEPGGVTLKFEWVERKKNYRSYQGKLFFRIYNYGNKGVFYVSSSAFNALGRPDKVKIGIDKENKAVAFCEDNENGYKASCPKGHGGATISHWNAVGKIRNMGYKSGSRVSLELHEKDDKKILVGMLGND